MTITLRHELLLLLGLSCLLILAIYLLPIPAMRVALGGAYVVFFPGYTLVAALFPGRRQLDAVERLRLSFGLSMAVMPLIGLVLKMVGTGRRLAQQTALAEELSVSEYVSFVGFVEHDNMPDHYAHADLFVLPSRGESFRLVLAEPLVCGLPVIATTAGAIREVVQHRITGVLVPPDDPQALAAAINSLLSNPQRGRAMGIAGRQRVDRHFLCDKVAERVKAGYQKILWSTVTAA